MVRVQRKEDAARVASELRKAGIPIRSVYDLVNSKRSYVSAIPILVDLLPTVSDDRTKEGIVRALTTKEAAGIAEPALFASLRASTHSSLGTDWATANALYSICGTSFYEELKALLCDSTLGAARQPILWALGRMKEHRNELVPLLVEHLADEDLVAHALIALRKLKAREAVHRIRPLLKSSSALVRREAKKAIDACSVTRAARRVGVPPRKTRVKKQAVQESVRKRRGHKSR